jgi:hypothetical protein
MKSAILAVLCIAALVALPLAGCASGRLVTLAIDPVVEKDAPVQIVSIQPAGDNLLATVTVKNTTSRDVQGFDVAWAILRPVGCAVSGPAPRLQRIGSESQSAHAEKRGTWTLPPGHTWGSRPLKAQEQTYITTLTLSRGIVAENGEGRERKEATGPSRRCLRGLSTGAGRHLPCWP